MIEDRLIPANMRIGLLMASGVFAAAQIGKAIVSIPLIQAEMGFGFDFAGLVVGIFALLGAAFGIGAGLAVQRIGARRSLVGGMMLISVGNVVGGTAHNELLILAARIIEGFGFIGVIVTVPSLIAATVSDAKRSFTMALWSAYMPAGITLMLLLAPLLSVIGWRSLWLASACMAGLFAALLHALAPVNATSLQRQPGKWAGNVSAVLANRDCLALALAFFLFSSQIFSMTFALPLVLASAHGLSGSQAGLLSAGMFVISTLGHIGSSFLLRSGVPIWANVAAAFLMFGVASFAVYGAHTPLPLVLLFAALALGVGGLAPGALYAAVPNAAPDPSSVPSTVGLLQQASNLGQLAGPLVLGLWLQHFTWSTAPTIVATAAAFGLATALIVRGRHAQRAVPQAG